MLGNFYAPTFFKINFFKKNFRNTIRVSNLLDPGRDLHPVGPDLGPKKLFANYYQQITKVTASKERVKLVPNILSTKSMGYWDIKKYKKLKSLFVA